MGVDVMEVRIRRDDTTSTEYVVHLGGNRYRLDSTPFPVDPDDEVWLGDIVELEPEENSVLLFRGMVSKSPWRHSDWVLGWMNSSAIRAFTDALETTGGRWEQVLGGYFYVHLPPDSKLDLDSEWEDCLRRFPDEEASSDPLKRILAYFRHIETVSSTQDSRKLDIRIDLVGE